MAGLDQPAAIDLVSLDADGSTVTLTIVQTGPWDPAQDVERLQEKLFNYVVFALDGQLVTTYPQLVGVQPVVALSFDHDLPPVLQDLWERAASAYAADGVLLRRHRLPS